MNMKCVFSTTLTCIASFAMLVSSPVPVSAQEQPKFVFDFSVGAGFRMPIEAKIVKGAPFSADIVTESIQTLSDGNRIVQRSTTRFYRDSEGRVRREEGSGSSSPVISITDPVSGLSYSLDPETKIARQMPNMAAFKVSLNVQKSTDLAARLPPDAAEKVKELAAVTQRLQEMQHRVELEKVGRAFFESGPAQQIKVEQLPARDMEGVRVVGTRRTATIAAGAIGNELPIEIVSEEWTSPELQVLVMTERRDPRLGTSTYRLDNINRTEPDRYLFEVPSDYTVRQTGPIRRAEPLRK